MAVQSDYGAILLNCHLYTLELNWMLAKIRFYSLSSQTLRGHSHIHKDTKAWATDSCPFIEKPALPACTPNRARQIRQDPGYITGEVE